MKKNKEYSLNFRTSVLFIVLSVIIVCLYFKTFDYGFVSYDDEGYIHENFEFLTQNFIEVVKWSFTTFEMANWHPLTWLSYSLDCHLFGYNAGGFHFINVLIHLSNTLLLFLFLKAATGTFWRSAVIAALFAVHPIQVESVAWISERKNLLSTFFGLLSMMCYVKYVRKENIKSSYILCFFFFILSLLSKPMLVTMPFIFMLLDYWPLERFSGEQSLRGIFKKLLSYLPEKTPFFIIILGSCIVTIVAQHGMGAVADTGMLPFSVRLANIGISYVEYIGKLLLPETLSVIYIFPYETSLVKALCSLSILIFITYLVLIIVNKQPYFFVGWFWFLGTLVPVIGIVQVGMQSMADRYMYIPSIGIFIMIVFLFSYIVNMTEKTAFKRFITAGISVIVLLSFSYST